jgi:hypothetical protein
MRLRLTLILVFLFGLFALTATASDFGAHVGEYQQDLQAWQVGADVMIPLGPIAFAPNVDYSRKSGIGWWFGNADVDLRYGNSSGGAWWVGAGPTYGYVTGYNSGSSTGYRHVTPLQYSGGGGGGTNPSPAFGGTSGSSNSAWGWDANAGYSFKTGGLKPYIGARYQKIKSFKSASGSIGLRF